MKKLLLLSCFCMTGAHGLLYAQNAQKNIGVVLANSASSNNTTGNVLILSPFATQTTPVNIIPIDSSSNNGLRISGSGTSTCYVGNSADGKLLTFTAFNTTTTTGNANLTLPRAVVTVNAAGTLAIATTYTGVSGQQTRSATTLDNINWYIGDQSGIYTNNATTFSPAGNFRAVKPFGGVVYVSANSSTATVIQVSALSAIGGTATGLPGLTNNASMMDFYMVRSGDNGAAYDVLYILSSTSASAGTIAKYSLVSGSWVANGSYTTSFGGFGLAALDSANGAYLYASSGTGASAANNVVRLYDAAGYNTTISITTANNVVLYTAPAGTTIKGVAFAPTLFPLAINLTGITAKNSGSTNIISWTTAHEDAGDNIEITRSTDGRSFTTIARVNGKGTNSSYSYTDNSPASGTNYYRLKINSTGGESSYSNVVSATVKLTGIATTILSPNPVNGQRFQLSFSNQLAGNCNIVVSNELGQVVYNQTQSVEGLNAISVTLPASLRKGIYYLNLSNNSDHFTRRIVVE